MRNENDYIAEYVKKKHPSLLGLDYFMWSMGARLSDVLNDCFNPCRSSNEVLMEQTGYWVEDRTEYKCSRCDGVVSNEINEMLKDTYDFPSYCPYCGVRMIREEQE